MRRAGAVVFAALVAGAALGCPPASNSPGDYSDQPWLRCQPGEVGVVVGGLEMASTEGRSAPVPGQMTERLAQAKRLYDSERWAEAQPLLMAAVRGETGDDAGNRQLAEYHAAIVYYRLRDPRAALSMFKLISSDPLHLRHNETLLWLLKLTQERETSVEAMQLLLRYDRANVQRFDNPQQRDLYALMLFGMGRAWYRQGDRAKAAALLDSVPRDSGARVLADDCLRMLR